MSNWHNPLNVTPKGESEVAIEFGMLSVPRRKAGLSDGEYQEVILTWIRQRNERLARTRVGAILAAG